MYARAETDNGSTCVRTDARTARHSILFREVARNGMDPSLSKAHPRLIRSQIDSAASAGRSAATCARKDMWTVSGTIPPGYVTAIKVHPAIQCRQVIFTHTNDHNRDKQLGRANYRNLKPFHHLLQCSDRLELRRVELDQCLHTQLGS